MWSQELLLVRQALLLFVGLSFLYWVAFKRIQWQSALGQALVGRIRLCVYFLIPLVTFAWVVRQLALLPEERLHPPESVRWISEYALFAVLGIFLVEAGGVFVFDYLFAVRRKIEVPHILREFLTRMRNFFSVLRGR